MGIKAEVQVTTGIGIESEDVPSRHHCTKKQNETLGTTSFGMNASQFLPEPHDLDGGIDHFDLNQTILFPSNAGV